MHRIERAGWKIRDVGDPKLGIGTIQVVGPEFVIVSWPNNKREIVKIGAAVVRFDPDDPEVTIFQKSYFWGYLSGDVSMEEIRCTLSRRPPSDIEKL